jgi:hypothetical protein
VLAALALAAPWAGAQEVPDLLSHYSGRAAWDEGSGTLEFQSSGRVDFGRADERSTIWEVPARVKRIVIGANVRVEAAFTLSSSAEIAGRGATSEIFGTASPALLHGLGLDHGGGCMPYSAVYAQGPAVVTVRDLTSRDPIGFHFTGRGAVFHLDHVAAIDDRGGFSNHSDGIQAAKGTTVTGSYFRTGDDVIKVYNDITVEDTTIEMIRNAVPVQLGWGSYGDGARGTFKNVTIIGDSGRDADFPVIAAQAGTYRKTLVFEDLKVSNSKASLFKFNDPGADVSVTIDGAQISVGRYSSVLKASGRRVICGRQDEGASFSCAN